MKQELKGTSYYATTDDNKDYLKENEEHNINIAYLEAEGDMTPTNICTAKLKVNISGELKDALQDGDTLLHIEGGRSKHDIDLSLLLDEYPIEFVVDESGTQEIKAYLKVTNRDADQTYIAGKTLSVTLTIEGLTCKVQNKDDAVEKILANEDQLEAPEDVSLRGDVLRRFQGTVTKREDGTIEDDINNYICFGADNKETCTEDTDHYMYRIIGVALNNDATTNTKYGQLKLIKKEALNDRIQWYKDYNTDIDWFQSDLYKAITEEKYLEDVNYVPTEWESKIVDHTWWTGDILYTNNSGWQDGNAVYKIETGKIPSEFNVLNMNSGQYSTYIENGIDDDPYYHKTINYDVVRQKWITHQSAKVGLMNLSDYYLAYGGKGETCAGNKDCINTWIHLSKNDLPTSDAHEWLMSRYGLFLEWGRYQASDIREDGVPWLGQFSYQFFARPVIYLTSGLELSGSGAVDDPYIIQGVEE